MDEQEHEEQDRTEEIVHLRVRRNPWRQPGAIGCQLVAVAVLLAMVVMLIISAIYRLR